MVDNKWDTFFKKREELLPPEEFIVNNGTLLKGKTVLDVASGDGRNAIYLFNKGYTVTAVDYSYIALDKIKNIQSKIETHLIDLKTPEKLNTLGSFDNIIINHYVPNEEALSIIQKILKPGGVIIIVGFNNSMSVVRPDRIELILDFKYINKHFNKLKIVKNETFTDQRGQYNGGIYEKHNF